MAINANSWIPTINSPYNSVNSHSWFDIHKIKNFDANDPITYNINNNDEFIRSYTIQLFPNANQINKLNDWFILFIIMYNTTIEFLRPHIAPNGYFINDDVMIDHCTNFKIVRNYLLEESHHAMMDFVHRRGWFTPALWAGERDIIAGNSRIPKHTPLRGICPPEQNKTSFCFVLSGHTLDEAIKHAVAKFVSKKTFINNYINKQRFIYQQRGLNFENFVEPDFLRRFDIQPWDTDDVNQNKIIIFESLAFSKTQNSIQQSALGIMNSDSSICKMPVTCTLIYDTKKKSYKLHVPITFNDKKGRNMISSFNDFDPIYQRIKYAQDGLINISKRRASVGIDPGVRTFMTTYSRYEVYEYCNKPNKILEKYYKKIDSAKRKYGAGLIGIKRMKKYTENGEKKIKNYIKDMHYKIAKHLVTKYDKIYLGKFNSRSAAQGRLRRRTKRIMNSLGHYKFRNILINQGKKYGSKVTLVSEYRTSKTCSSCRELNEIGGSRIYNCQNCGMIAGRDINAAKNIYKRGKGESP
jgi:IS605 OrfB family transposase